MNETAWIRNLGYSLEVQKMTLRQRAQTDSFSALRLMNLQSMAAAAHKNGDVETLLNFTIEGLPLAYYLAI